MREREDGFSLRLGDPLGYGLSRDQRSGRKMNKGGGRALILARRPLWAEVRGLEAMNKRMCIAVLSVHLGLAAMGSAGILAVGAQAAPGFQEVSTEAFTADLPEAWAAYWVAEERKLIAAKSTTDPTAPTMIVRLASSADAVDPDQVAAVLARDSGGVQFQLSVDLWGEMGHLLIFKSADDRLRAAFWRAHAAQALAAGFAPAEAVYFAPANRFNRDTAEELVRQVARGVRAASGESTVTAPPPPKFEPVAKIPLQEGEGGQATLDSKDRLVAAGPAGGDASSLTAGQRIVAQAQRLSGAGAPPIAGAAPEPNVETASVSEEEEDNGFSLSDLLPDLGLGDDDEEEQAASEQVAEAPSTIEAQTSAPTAESGAPQAPSETAENAAAGREDGDEIAALQPTPSAIPSSTTRVVAPQPRLGETVSEVAPSPRAFASYLGRALGSVDVSPAPSRASRALSNAFQLTLDPGGDALAVMGDGERRIGVWRREGDALVIEWPPERNDGRETTPWNLEIFPDGLGVAMTRLRPVRELTLADLQGQLELDGGPPLSLSVGADSREVKVTRATFQNDGMFYAGDDEDDNGAQGAYRVNGPNVMLKFFTGGVARFPTRVLIGSDATPTIIDIDGHYFRKR